MTVLIGYCLRRFQTRFFIFSENEIGAWSPGTGAEILAGLCDPGLAKFNQFATKLRKWPAITETIDEGERICNGDRALFLE